MEPNVARPAPAESTSLPREVPALPLLEFEGPDGGWPPRPRRQRAGQPVEAQPIPGTLTETLAERIRAAALAHQRVQGLLGARFDHLHTDMLDLGKDRQPHPAQPIATRVSFFSHTNNVAVEVDMLGLQVRAVRTCPGSQPPEGDGEIARAIALARADDRIATEVAGLEAHAILVPMAAEDVGYGQRVLCVVFIEAGESVDEKLALFTATVDVIGDQVLMAGRVPRPRRTVQTRRSTRHAE